MCPTTRRVDLPAKHILIWLVLLAGLIANSMLSLVHLSFGGSGLLVVSLWAVRLVVLGACWLLPAPRTAKAWGLGLILGFLVLDALLKAPVLGHIEYGDWFLARAFDLTGQYAGYLGFCGFLFPLLLLTGWFIFRTRQLAGWLTGFAASLLLSWAMLAASNSEQATTTLFVLLGVARYVLPAWLAAAADAVAARRRLSTKP